MELGLFRMFATFILESKIDSKDLSRRLSHVLTRQKNWPGILVLEIRGIWQISRVASDPKTGQ